MVVVAYEACGLQGVYEVILFFEFPVEAGGVLVVVPASVEPYGSYFAVVRQQLCKLSVHEAIIRRPVGFRGVTSGLPAGASDGIILACPVEM